MQLLQLRKESLKKNEAFFSQLQKLYASMTAMIFFHMKRVLLLRGTVYSELKIIQNRSKYRFSGKRTTTYRRLGNTTFI